MKACFMKKIVANFIILTSFMGSMNMHTQGLRIFSKNIWYALEYRNLVNEQTRKWHRCNSLKVLNRPSNHPHMASLFIYKNQHQKNPERKLYFVITEHHPLNIAIKRKNTKLIIEEIE